MIASEKSAGLAPRELPKSQRLITDAIYSVAAPMLDYPAHVT